MKELLAFKETYSSRTMDERMAKSETKQRQGVYKKRQEAEIAAEMQNLTVRLMLQSFTYQMFLFLPG